MDNIKIFWILLSLSFISSQDYVTVTVDRNGILGITLGKRFHQFQNN